MEIYSPSRLLYICFIAQATVKECEDILHKINTHPLAAMVSGAKKLLFGN